MGEGSLLRRWHLCCELKDKMEQTFGKMEDISRAMALMVEDHTGG